MAQGFINQSGIALPLAVAQGGTGQTASTGSGAVVLTASPTITTPNIVGTSTNNNAAAGSVGEYVSSNIAAASAISILNNIEKNLTSISLSAGDWQVGGNVKVLCSTQTLTRTAIGINSTSATLPDGSYYNEYDGNSTTMLTGGDLAPERRFSLSGTTTIYIVAFASFSSGTGTMCGNLWARRIR